MKVFNAFFALYRTVLYVVVAVFLLVAVGPMAVGIRPYVVLSASMEPVIMTGSLVYVQKNDSKSPLADLIEYKEPQKGDIVAFKQGSGDTAITVIHRIHDINAKGEYIMKGDNNSNTDIASISKDNIIGNYKFSIPVLGKVVQMLQTKQGLIAAVVLMVIAFASSFISDGSEDEEVVETTETVDEAPEAIIEEKPKKKKLNKGFKKKNKTDIKQEKETENKTAEKPVVSENSLNTETIVKETKENTNSLWGEHFAVVPYDQIKKMQNNILAPNE